MLHPNFEKRPTSAEVCSTLEKFKKDLEKPKFIKIFMGSKSRIITNSEKFTRALAKSSFDNYKEIFTNQFEIILDTQGDWFIKGLPVPKTAKTKTGESVFFYPTKINHLASDLFHSTIYQVRNARFRTCSKAIKKIGFIWGLPIQLCCRICPKVIMYLK